MSFLILFRLDRETHGSALIGIEMTNPANLGFTDWAVNVPMWH